MAYRRQISYLDLTENKIKRGNAGFVKWEKYDECHILSVFVNGLENSRSKEAVIELEDGHSIGKIQIRKGRGEGTYLLTRGEKDWVEDIGAIRIVLGESEELLAIFNECKKNISPKPEENISRKEELPELPEETDTLQKEVTTELLPERNLWKILGETHELFYPFNDENGCYRIFPKDIRVFHANYHGLESNQFLMHGYYNYRHLIIFPKKDKTGEYWLGVPGIYHEREKMAARMFGFQKFEATKKEYKAGDQGYYLITVEG